MSIHQPVMVPHPLHPDETVVGHRVGERQRTDSPFSMVTVEIGDGTWSVPEEDICD